MRISDWSSDVCSSDLDRAPGLGVRGEPPGRLHPLKRNSVMSRITKPEWLQNPWRTNPWFESVAVAQQRARKRLPAPVYGALVAGSERGQSISDNQSGFSHLGFAPHVAGHHAKRELGTSVLGQEISDRKSTRLNYS